MIRRAFALVAVVAAFGLAGAAPAQAGVGPSSITVGPVTLGNPGCC
jgi:hypothetical protein